MMFELAIWFLATIGFFSILFYGLCAVFVILCLLKSRG